MLKRRPNGHVEANKAIVRASVDSWNRRDLDHLPRLWSPSAIYHSRFRDYDAQTVTAAYAAEQQAFPDLHLQVEDLVGEGNKVVVRLTARGTHTGTFLGFQPTGRMLQFELIEIVRLAGGKIVEQWAVSDELFLVQQLGLGDDSSRRVSTA